MKYFEIIIKTKKYLKSIIFGSLAIFTVSMISYFVSQDLYMSDAIFEVRETSNQNQSPVNLRNIASIANVGGLLGEPNSSDFGKVMEKIESRDIAEKIFQNDEVLTFLLAAKGFDLKKKQVIYDQDIFDTKSNSFVNKFASKNTAELYELGYKKYLKALSVSENQNGFINIRVSSMSPIFSKELIELVKDLINQDLSEIRKKELENSLKYLDSIIENSKDISIRNSLINEQLNIQKDLMTLNVRKDYVLTYIDSPNTPVDKYSPRLLFHILASIIISILYLMVVLIFFED